MSSPRQVSSTLLVADTYWIDTLYDKTSHCCYCVLPVAAVLSSAQPERPSTLADFCRGYVLLGCWALRMGPHSNACGRALAEPSSATCGRSGSRARSCRFTNERSLHTNVGARSVL